MVEIGEIVMCALTKRSNTPEKRSRLSEHLWSPTLFGMDEQHENGSIVSDPLARATGDTLRFAHNSQGVSPKEGGFVVVVFSLRSLSSGFPLES